MMTWSCALKAALTSSHRRDGTDHTPERCRGKDWAQRIITYVVLRVCKVCVVLLHNCDLQQWTQLETEQSSLVLTSPLGDSQGPQVWGLEHEIRQAGGGQGVGQLQRGVHAVPSGVVHIHVIQRFIGLKTTMRYRKVWTRMISCSI